MIRENGIVQINLINRPVASRSSVKTPKKFPSTSKAFISSFSLQAYFCIAYVRYKTISTYTVIWKRGKESW